MIKVLLVDDHPVVRSGFRYLLENLKQYEVSEAGSAEDAYQIYNQLQPDVVVLDLSMPGMGGLEGIRRLCARDQDVRILVMSMYDDPLYVSQARDMGAKGYLSKNSATDELPQAISALMAGKEYLGADINRQLETTKTRPNETYGLSNREFEIFCLLADGRTVIDIAKVLNLSHKTVNNHRTKIMGKLGLKNNVELTRLAIRQGIIQA